MSTPFRSCVRPYAPLYFVTRHGLLSRHAAPLTYALWPMHYPLGWKGCTSSSQSEHLARRPRLPGPCATNAGMNASRSIVGNIYAPYAACSPRHTRLDLHVTHIHGLARVQRPKRPGYPHIAAERETADAAPWVPRPQKLTDYRAGDLLRLGNDSCRRKRLCTGL